MREREERGRERERKKRGKEKGEVERIEKKQVFGIKNPLHFPLNLSRLIFVNPNQAT